MSPFGLILLAAGGSTRLGRPKQMLPHRGRSLLRHAAETAVASACRPVVVVLGAQWERMRAELDGLPVRPGVNPHWERGMASSLHAGLAMLRGDPLDGVVIMLCDQPAVTSALIDALIAAWERTSAPLAAAEYAGTLGVPALFSRALLPELAALSGAEGAKRVILRHAAEAARVPFPGGEVDIDTVDDLVHLTSG